MSATISPRRMQAPVWRRCRPRSARHGVPTGKPQLSLIESREAEVSPPLGSQGILVIGVFNPTGMRGATINRNEILLPMCRNTQLRAVGARPEQLFLVQQAEQTP